jgi:hypothetical protein
MTNSYIERTRWFETASKVKIFIQSPEAYAKTFIEEIALKERDPKCFIIGTAFDDYLSHGADYFFDKYFLDEGLLVSEMVERCIERGITVESKESKDSLMKKLYGNFDKKTRLTAMDAENVMGMIAEAMRQPLWDVPNWEYEAQKVVQCEYKGLKLQGTLDRLSLEKWLIRDYKTTAKLSDFAFKLSSEYGYEVSMAFYYALVKIVHEKECDVILDVVQSSYPYPSEVFQYQTEKLHQVFNQVILPALDSLAAMHTIYRETGDKNIWTTQTANALRSDLYKLDAYPVLETAKQTMITYI